MKSFNFKVLIIFSLFSFACFIPSKTDVSYGCVNEEPNKSEIIGTWIADRATLADMKVRGNYDSSVIPKLIFHEDGRLEAANIPDWWLDGFGKSNQSFISSSGNWKFYRYKQDCVQIGLSLQIVSTNIDLLKSRFNRQPKYIMTQYIGDPDSGDSIVFVKEN